MIGQFALGMVLGLAGSAHCAGICGPLVCSVNLAVRGGERLPGMLQTHLRLNAGRVAVQALFGALAGAMGGSVLRLAADDRALTLGHWAMALMLAWNAVGLLGLAPGPGILRRLMPKRFALPAGAPPMVLGMAWGLMPCGMVYGALMLALTSGGAATGAATMLGFGLGTAPALTAVLLGALGLRVGARGVRFRKATGAVLLAFALGSLALPVPQWAGLCAGIAP